MDKRRFIKSLGALSFSPFISANQLSDFKPISKILPVINNEDDLWDTVRSHYTLKEEYINLESGYYNIIPNPILEHFINHVKHVNIEGSFYMRKNLNKNKDRVTSELANLVGSNQIKLLLLEMQLSL